MSKYVKNLITDHLRDRLKNVDDALLVDVVGLDVNTGNRLRAEFAQKDIRVMVVKNSLARRATAGTPLAAMFERLTGSSAVCWGGGRHCQPGQGGHAAGQGRLDGRFRGPRRRHGRPETLPGAGPRR